MKGPNLAAFIFSAQFLAVPPICRVVHFMNLNRVGAIAVSVLLPPLPVTPAGCSCSSRCQDDEDEKEVKDTEVSLAPHPSPLNPHAETLSNWGTLGWGWLL